MKAEMHVGVNPALIGDSFINTRQERRPAKLGCELSSLTVADVCGISSEKDSWLRSPSYQKRVPIHRTMELEDSDSGVTLVIHTLIIPSHVAVAFAEPICEVHP